MFLPILIVFIFLLPILLLFAYFQVAAFSFGKLGLSTEMALLILIACLIGSHINIPVSRRIYRYSLPRPFHFYDLFFYYPPLVREHVLAVNVGGALIPSMLALWLLMRTPLLPAVTGVFTIALFSKAVARPVRGVGITMPAFFPPLMAAAIALLIGGDHSAEVAYISGVWGTLIGADLLNLPAIRKMNAHWVSIGGAGVFDGIFLVGLFAAFLS